MLTNKLNVMDWFIVLFIIGFTSITVSFVIKIMTYFAQGIMNLF